jgi:flagellar motor switch protein FliN/FliY
MSESSKTEKVSPKNTIMEQAESLMDVLVHINIQLDSCNMKVRDILQLKQRSILELPKSAGENVDILVNDHPLASGEVLELEGATGIRLTDLVQNQ